MKIPVASPASGDAELSPRDGGVSPVRGDGPRRPTALPDFEVEVRRAPDPGGQRASCCASRC